MCAKSRVKKLSSCQEDALELLKANVCVFLTGLAGTGKSHLIGHYINNFSKNPVILASTGAAAVLIGGRTFHSFFGLGILEGGPEKAVEAALARKPVVKRIRKAEEVIIDEISMLRGTDLEAAEKVARLGRKDPRPWGGLKVHVVGDFAQLPPVPDAKGNRDWAFRSNVWKDSGFKPAYLREIVRSREAEFLAILNEVRHGRSTPEVADYLDARRISVGEKEGCTHLFPHRATVENFNLKKLENVRGKVLSLETQYSGEKAGIEALKRNAPIPEVLQLKEGALVMIRQNDPSGRWVNGSLATVRKIHDEAIIVELSEGDDEEIVPATFKHVNAEGVEIASATNFPLNLAWATTIHKSQGCTLDRVVMDLRGLWEPGHAYTALSRVRSGKGLFITGWTPASIRADSEVLALYAGLEGSVDGRSVDLDPKYSQETDYSDLDETSS
ncbi:AAA family ATPase [Bdellovibrionota bacterium FG-2]